MFNIYYIWIVCREIGYVLHHTAAVRRQSVVGIVDVCHILGAPQPLCHSTSTRPITKRKKKDKSTVLWCVIVHVFSDKSLWSTRVWVWGWWRPHTLPTNRLLHQSQASFVLQFLFRNVIFDEIRQRKQRPGNLKLPWTRVMNEYNV